MTAGSPRPSGPGAPPSSIASAMPASAAATGTVGAAAPGVGDSSNMGAEYIFADAGASIWAAAAAGDTAYLIPGGVYAPAAAFTGGLPSPSLAAFDGQPYEGTWTLTVSDNAGADP